MILLGQVDSPCPVQDALKAHPALSPGQGTARARVDASSEGNMGLGIGAVGSKLVRTLEPSGVAVRCTVEEHDRCPGGNVNPPDRRRAAGEAEVCLDWALDSQHLFNEIRDPTTVST